MTNDHCLALKRLIWLPVVLRIQNKIMHWIVWTQITLQSHLIARTSFPSIFNHILSFSLSQWCQSLTQCRAFAHAVLSAEIFFLFLSYIAPTFLSVFCSIVISITCSAVLVICFPRTITLYFITYIFLHLFKLPSMVC